MKVLVTGATGFIGSHIVDRLCDRGIATAVLVRPASNQRFLAPCLPRLEVRTGSITDADSLCHALRDVTHVIHSAGCTKALRAVAFDEVNHLGTKYVVEAVNERLGQIKRLVHISSLAAGGPATRERPAREDAPPRPISTYGRSKLAGEQAVRNGCNAQYVILRPPAVYGPRDDGFLSLFKAVASHVLPRLGSSRMALSLVFVKDLAEAAVTCLTHPAAVGRTFYVASPEVTTAHALAGEIAAQLGRWTIPLPLPTALLWPVCVLQELVTRITARPNILNRQKYAELRAPGWVCDPARLREELGLVCATPLAAGVSETAAWYRRHGWL